MCTANTAVRYVSDATRSTYEQTSHYRPGDKLVGYGSMGANGQSAAEPQAAAKRQLSGLEH
jgi:hypothetical protein